MKRDFGRILIYSMLLSLAISYIPAIFGITDPFVCDCIYLIADLVLLLFVGNSLARQGVFSDGRQTPHWKHLLILSPTVLLIIGNILYNSLEFGEPSLFLLAEVNEAFFLQLAIVIVGAVYDELLFRLILQYSWFSNCTRIKRIIYSALVFAAFETLSLGVGVLFTSIIYLLSIFACSFLLGCILGFLMEYTHSIYVCMVYHVIYSLFAMVETLPYLGSGLLSLLFGGYFEISTGGIILLVSMAVTSLYLVFSYFYYFKKKEY